ncbi:hypothetical protein Tco_0033718 [Tanacetum coccineum]
MIDASRDDVLQEKLYEQVEDDAHVTLTATHFTQKTEGPMQSSSISSDFVSQFLNLDNVSPVDNEVVSMMNVKVRHEEPKFKKKAYGENKRYIDLIKKSVKDIIKDEVKNQLPYILPKEVSDYATSMIQNTITESLKNVILAKSPSRPKSTYEAAIETVKTRTKTKTLLLDQTKHLKRRTTRKDAEPSKGSKSKESKSSSSKGTKSQPKSSSKSAQAEESMFESVDTEMSQNQGSDLGNTDDQPNVEATSKHDWFKKPERPPTPDLDWNATKTIDFKPPQTWISKNAK